MEKFCNILHTFYLFKSSITAKINKLKVLKLEFDMKKNAKLIKVNWLKPLKNTCEGVDS